MVLLGLLLAAAGGLLVWTLSQLWWAGLIAAAMLFWVPILKVSNDRARRFAEFEEGLPDALDAMVRALKAGHPFNETLRLVAD